MIRKTGTTTIQHLLNDPRVRKTQLGSRTCYAAVDLLAVLTGSADPQRDWEDLKRFDPGMKSRCLQIELPEALEPQDVLPLPGVMRLIQSVDSPRAQRLRGWMDVVAAQHVEEEADPELAVQRMRQSYGSRGHSRQWIDQRLRSISARHELVSEWYKRGVKEGDQFSALTNRLMQGAFGMDVNAWLRLKGATRNLRDHLDDLELSLLSLAETTAANLHRKRQSAGLDQLLRDVDDAAQIIAQTRHLINGDAASFTPPSTPTDMVAA